MTIEGYLVELRRHLRVGPLTRQCILREVEAHLMDSAERRGSEESAVESFGPPEVVAARLSSLRRYPLRRFGPSLGAAAALATAFVALLDGVSGTAWVTNPIGGCTIIEVGSGHGKGNSVAVLPTPDGASTSTVTVRLKNSPVTASRPNQCDP